MTNSELIEMVSLPDDSTIVETKPIPNCIATYNLVSIAGKWHTVIISQALDTRGLILKIRGHVGLNGAMQSKYRKVCYLI